MHSRGDLEKTVLRIIRQIVLEEAVKLGVEIDEIVLFGSRARGEAREDSDYDILVVVKGNVGRVERRILSTRIASRAARELLIPVDVIVTTVERWRKYSKTVGTVEEAAAGEGGSLVGNRPGDSGTLK
ncbi:nucleotidyltransferase domain-containing protein [Aeropyrum camini]|nr:nucleotidyltransferase domain-containing protein [Aeropyrum camini]